MRENKFIILILLRLPDIYILAEAPLWLTYIASHFMPSGLARENRVSKAAVPAFVFQFPHLTYLYHHLLFSNLNEFYIVLHCHCAVHLRWYLFVAASTRITLNWLLTFYPLYNSIGNRNALCTANIQVHLGLRCRLFNPVKVLVILLMTAMGLSIAKHFPGKLYHTLVLISFHYYFNIKFEKKF